MAKIFDATTKHLIEAHPADWLLLAGLPAPADVQVVDADLSSFTLAADKLIRVGGDEPYIAHLELQSGSDRRLDRRVLVYNAVAGERHELPVRSVVFLLRPEALSPHNVGYVQDVSDPHCRLAFSYRLVRVWELPPDNLLRGGLGTLPLAAISAVTQRELPGVLEEIAARLERDAPQIVADEVWLATFLLSGLRHSADMIRPLMKRVRRMEESSTYQAILAEGAARGEARGRRDALIRIGTRRFGPPDARVRAVVESIHDLDRLSVLTDRLLDVTGWDELLLAEA